MRRFAIHFVLFAFLVLLVSPVSAQPMPEEEQWVECDYPDGCTLYMVAIMPQARKGVHAWVDVTAADGTITRIDAEPFPSGRFVEAEAVWHAHPPTVLPWTEFSYRWTVLRDNGTTSRPLPTATAEYEDGTLEWERSTGSGVIVFSYGHSAEEQAALLASAQGGYGRMESFLNTTPERDVRVLVYNNWPDFKQVLGFHDQTTTTIGGQAFASQGITAQWSSCMDCLTEKEIPHEIAHVFYEEMFPYASVPSWFAEGLAVRNEDHDFSGEAQRIERMAGDGDLVPWSQMAQERRRNRTTEEVLDWYAQAYQSVAYIEQEYGTGRLRSMIVRLHNGQMFEDVVPAEAQGHSLEQIEDNWRKSLKAEPINEPIVEVNAQALETKARGWMWGAIEVISSPWLTRALAALLALAIWDRVRMRNEA